MRGRGWLQAVHPDFREATERKLNAAIADRRVYLMEFRLRLDRATDPIAERVRNSLQGSLGCMHVRISSISSSRGYGFCLNRV